MSSTSARALECTVARSSRKARPTRFMRHPDSVTGQYLSGRKKIVVPAKRTPRDKKKLLKLKGARGNNLQNVNLEIPVGLLTCVTGVSGSGKSTLINNTLFPLTATALNARRPWRSLPTTASTACSTWTRWWISTRAPSAGPRAPTRRPIPDSSPPSASCFPAFRNPVLAATPGALLLQRQGWPLRGLPGRWGHQGGDALPAGRLRRL